MHSLRVPYFILTHTTGEEYEAFDFLTQPFASRSWR